MFIDLPVGSESGETPVEVGLHCGHLRPGELPDITHGPPEGVYEHDRQALLLRELSKGLPQRRLDPRLVPILSDEERWFLVLPRSGLPTGRDIHRDS